MNVSNASATNKTPLPESGAKTSAENSQNKGFLETLTGVFTGSQKEQAKPVNPTTEVSEKRDPSAAKAAESEGGGQESTAVVAEMSQAEELGDVNSTNGVDNDATLSMDEGQQLLGRIEQANQTLSTQSRDGTSGNRLPSGSTEWHAKLVSGSQADWAQRISVEELEVIDTKLSQGKALTEQEAEILDGLQAGTAIAELTEEELAQLVALPGDVKQALSEAQVAQSNLNRPAAASALTQQAVSQELKHAAVHTPAQVADKTVLPEGVVAAGGHSAIELAAVNTDVSHKAINVASEVRALKALADQQDKTELPHGLAGQLQAAATQQGGATSPQARLDAAQQAQLPLQLTKEAANEQVAEKVQMMMSKNLKNLDIRLDPPELGRMQIRLTMNSDLANVHFTVTNPQARDIIEQTLPRLREMLAQQGMQLADSSVQQQNHGEQQGGYSAMGQNRQGSDGRGVSGLSDDGIDTDIEVSVNVASSRDGISYYA